jgi:hypothetical protein
MLVAWWCLLRGKSQKSNVEGTTLFSSCLLHTPRVNSPQTWEIQANSSPQSPTDEGLRSVALKGELAIQAGKPIRLPLAITAELQADTHELPVVRARR